MAKAKSEVNKSEEIRTVLAATPGASAKEVVAALKKKSIDVTDALVYAVKTNLNGKKKKPGKAPKAKSMVAASPSSPKVHLGVGASIALAKMTAEKVGGWRTLKEIVDALA
jgi:hypothetical protein